MNVIELAKAEGLHIYPEHRSAFERFAAAVIKAHEAKLIEGVGEPHYWSQRMEDDTVNMVPFYYPEQLAAAVAKKNAEVEQLRVQLAGCGVAAMQNTESSKSQRAVKGDYGYSESYADVCRAVDREIEQRKRITELEAEIAASEKQVEILTDTLAESRKQNKQLLEALRRIQSWDEHTSKFYTDYGSDGVRDFYRQIARAAIAAAEGK